MTEHDGGRSNDETESGVKRRRFLTGVGLGGGMLVGGWPDAVAGSGVPGRTGANLPALDTTFQGGPFPDYPESPFMVVNKGQQYLGNVANNGYEPNPFREELRTISRLHPDFLSFRPLLNFRDGEPEVRQTTVSRAHFSLRSGIPTIGGDNIAIPSDPEVATDRLGPLMDASGWTYPDGIPVENPTEIHAKTFDGTPHVSMWTDFLSMASPFAPGTRELSLRVADAQLSMGYGSFYLDGVASTLWRGLDFSVWARAAFREHLRALPSGRREELGVEDPASFDIREYLRNEGLTPATDDHPATDPVFQEYVVHVHQGVKAMVGAIREDLHDRFPDRVERGGLVLSSNQAQLREGLPSPQAPAIYTSDHLDAIEGENGSRVGLSEDYAYKLRHAAGRFEKDAYAEDVLEKLVEGGADPDERYPMATRFQSAEALAMGAVKKVQLNGDPPDEEAYYWIQTDGTVADELLSFNDFVWAHERFLADTALDNDVALVYSLPDRLWDYLPQWDIGKEGRYGQATEGRPRLHSFVGTAGLLREAQLSYDVVVFGHPRLWEDGDQLARLERYDTVVVPDIRTITDAQSSALEEHVADGGRLVVSGTPPSRTEMFGPRANTGAAFDHENTTVLDSDPGRRKFEAGSADDTLVEAVRETTSTTLAAPDPALVVNRTRQSDPDRTVVHLLNHDYEPETDSFATREELSVRVRKRGRDLSAARYVSPQESTSLEVTDRGDAVEVRVPRLVEWGFVVLGDSPEVFDPAVTEGEARDVYEEATSRLEAARERGEDWAPEFVVAETRLEAARIAESYGAWGQMRDAAVESIAAAEATASPQPVVAIDQAHGQPGSWAEEDSLQPIEETVSEFQYRELTDWSAGALSDVDVLVVPPAIEFRGGRHEFEPSELEQIEAFVANGGSLLVLGAGGVASDIGALTERFGYEFTGQPIVFPQEVEDPVATTHDQHHSLTRGLPHVSAQKGSPIAKMPERATELAALPEDSAAWLHSTGEYQTREDSEESAAGRPTFAVSSEGEGTVAVLGTYWYLARTHRVENAEEVVRTLLSALGRAAVTGTRSTATTTDTATTTETPPDTATTTETPTDATTETDTSGSGSGFGVASAVAGLGGLGYLLSRFGSDGTDD